MREYKKGFTLAELIIVIAVIAVLAAVLIIVLPVVIGNANNASASSDAANTKTTYTAYVAERGSYTDDCIVIVEKASKLYLYGYIDDRIQSSIHNPFAKDNIEHFIADLTDRNIISVTGERQPENVAAFIPDILPNVYVYTGYRLNDFVSELYFRDSLINIEPGERVNVSAVVMPEADILYESNHPEIAAVDESGTVSGISAGMATITASCGEKTASMIVNVIDYIEFYGDAVQLKQYFEETGDATIYIRLMDDISCYDMTLLPIILPENKLVKLDLNGHIVHFFQYVDSGLPAPDCVIKNTGGSFVLEDSSPQKIGSIKGYFASEVEFSSSVPHYYSTICNEKGSVTVPSTIYTYATMNTLATNSFSCFVENHDRLTIENFDTSLDAPDNYYMPVSYIFVYNAPGGHAVLRNINVPDSIINEGVIECIDNCRLGGYDFVIKNSGTILEIKDCEMQTYYWLDNVSEAAIMSSGRIASIENTVLRTGIHTEDHQTNLPAIALSVSGGSVGTIRNCTFLASDKAIVMTNAVLDTPLTDGTYSNEIDARLIADGYRCIENDGMYKIVRE